jgi:hypothetical protein
LVDPRDDRETREFSVGFVEDDGGVRGSFQDCFDDFFLQQSARGVVGIADEEDARFG